MTTSRAFKGSTTPMREFLTSDLPGLPPCSWRSRLCLNSPVRAAADKAPPNVVLIIADDMGWTDYGFMGHPHIRTPRLDRLAGQGLAYRRGYATTSLCSPSLASILTGRYPHQHRITSNDPPLPPGHGRADGPPRSAIPGGTAGR